MDIPWDRGSFQYEARFKHIVGMMYRLSLVTGGAQICWISFVQKETSIV